MKSKDNLLRTTLSAVMMALICVFTLLVRIPTVSKGYLNLGDCAVLFCGWLLGPLWGTAAAGLGSALADLLAGYPIYIPGTLVIKSVMGLTVALFVKYNSKKQPHRFNLSFAAGSVAAELIMVAGYYIYEALIIGIGFGPALAGVTGNVIQAAAGVLGAYFLVAILGKNDIINSVRKNERR